MVAAFTGWNDAGDAGSSALRLLVEAWDAKPLATIDPEEFTDYATVRPHVRLTGDGGRTIVWPATAAWSASPPGGDVILVLGPEPAMRWRAFCEQLLAIANRHGVVRLITLGALLAEVPHTRASPVISTSADADLIERYDLARSRYEGPTGILGALGDAMGVADIPSAALWATVPAYLSHQPSPLAAASLLEALGPLLGTEMPTAGLTAQVARYRADADEQVAADADLVTFVEQLEQMYDRGELDDDALDEDLDDEGDDQDDVAEFARSVDDSAELLAEVEQYLREHGNG